MQELGTTGQSENEKPEERSYMGHDLGCVWLRAAM